MKNRRAILASSATIALLAATPAVAQTQSEDTTGDTVARQTDDIVVTATKKVGTVSVQSAPLAVTAFGQASLQDSHVVQISDLTGQIPNVFLNTSETIHGVNNFTIRGMGVYDTIPSNTPTVGIFVDGVYIGASAASSLSTFDNASIEVLRGPQGLLFGRNVTAGAILVNTSNPTDKLHVSAQASVESGPNWTESLVVSGPLNNSGTLTGKLAAFRNDDEGYFTNQFDGSKFGKSHTTLLRGALAFTPSSTFKTTLKFEHGNMDGQGPASQDHGTFSADGFGFSINEPGYAHNKWDQVISDTRIKVGLGDGEIVNIFGWRRVDEAGLFDADSRPQTFFHFGTAIRQHQWSDELRYSGRFGPVTPTIGVFYYKDDLDYVEARTLAAANLAGGGNQKTETYALFSNFDIDLTKTFVLTLGARYSGETKRASVRGLVSQAASSCSLAAGECTSFNFTDSHTWHAFTPKVGLQWNPDSTTNVYAYWTKGFRSGGYNLRQTNLLAPPGPYDQEVENSFEIGVKKQFFERRLRFNFALFQNDYQNLQRAIFQSSPTIGISQTTVNSADTRIRGVEVEAQATPVEGFRISAHAGYLDNQWQTIYFHLSGAGPVTPADYALELPFLSPWSYGVNVGLTVPAGSGEIAFNASYDHRDRTPSNDANTGILKAVDRIDANLTWRLGNGLAFSVYGKNLTNEATTGLNNPLTFTPGETIAPLNKGRILGLEVRYSM
jgi:iron complex outermembrane receptor protein